jgi:hypothetical protein
MADKDRLDVYAASFSSVADAENALAGSMEPFR